MDPSEVTERNLKQARKIGVNAVLTPLKDKLAGKIRNISLNFTPLSGRSKRQTKRTQRIRLKH